jgi:hypothetical protein
MMMSAGNRQTSSSSASGQSRNRKYDERLQQQSSLSDIEPPQSAKQLVRVRSFTTRSGTVVNRGDSFKSRSNRGSSGTGSGGTPRLTIRPVSSRTDSRRGIAGGDDDDDEIAANAAIANGRRPARRSLPQAGWSTEYGGAGPLIVNVAPEIQMHDELMSSTGAVPLSDVARESPARTTNGSGQLQNNGIYIIASSLCIRDFFISGSTFCSSTSGSDSILAVS